jgi:hypothetical protein
MVKSLGLSALLIAFWTTAGWTENYGTVRVRVEDFGGVPLLANVTIMELGTKKLTTSVTSNAQKEVSALVPYGWYSLKIESAGFRTYERPLKVLGPAVYVRSTLTAGEPVETRVVGRYVATSTIQGSLQGKLPERGDLWAKLVPIFGSEDNLMESKIDPNGSFRFDGMDPGNYLIVILDGRRVITTEQVQSAAKKMVTIRLP